MPIITCHGQASINRSRPPAKDPIRKAPYDGDFRCLVEDFDRGLFGPAFNMASSRFAAGTTGSCDGTSAAVDGARPTEQS